MRPYLLVLTAGTFLLPAVPAAMPHPEAVAKLKDLGGTVIEEKGVIVGLSFKDCSKLGDAEFRLIGSLTALRKLTLYGKCTGLTDATLAHLTKLTQLEEFQTDQIQVTDAGLKQLTAFRNLRALALFHVAWGQKGFTGADLAALAELPKLERVTVGGSPFNDEGMAALGKLTRLQKLGTWHTAQTAAGTASLRNLTHLRELRLGQTIFGKTPSLDDGTLTTLAEMKSLEVLTLDEARLSLDALRRLKGLPNLKKLTLLAIDLPAADVERLRGELPGVAVSHTPPTDAQMKMIHRLFGKN